MVTYVAGVSIPFWGCYTVTAGFGMCTYELTLICSGRKVREKEIKRTNTVI